MTYEMGGATTNYQLYILICLILILILGVVAIFIWKSKVNQQLRALKRIGEMMKKSGMDMDYEDPGQMNQQYAGGLYEEPAQQPEEAQADIAQEAEVTQPDVQQPEILQADIPQPEMPQQPEIPQADIPQPDAPADTAEILKGIQEPQADNSFAANDPLFKFQQMANETAPNLQEAEEQSQVIISDFSAADAPQFEQAMPQQPQAPQFEQAMPQQPQAPQFEQAMPQQPQAPQFEQAMPQQPQAPQFEQAMPQQPQAPQFEQPMPQQPQMQPQNPQQFAGNGGLNKMSFDTAKGGRQYDMSEIESIIKD